MSLSFLIRKAVIADLAPLLPLFSAYRKFYQQPNIPANEEGFLRHSLEESTDVIFIAELIRKKQPVIAGFARLTPGTCSLSLRPYWTFYDLFVDKSFRQKGCAQALLAKIEEFAKETQASRVQLETAVSNTAAQKLYTRQGYVPTNDSFLTYTLELPEALSLEDSHHRSSKRIAAKIAGQRRTLHATAADSITNTTSQKDPIQHRHHPYSRR